MRSATGVIASYFLFLLMIVSRTSLYAQNEKLIVIENADSLLGKIINGESAQELIGNVRFSQDRVRVACDSATQFKQSGNVLLKGNVTVQDDSLTMRFRSGMFYRDDRRAVAYDSVMLDDGKIVLTARFGEYRVDEKRAFFKTKVEAKDKESSLSADSLIYFRADEHIIAMNRVVIVSFSDNMTIRGHHFESWRTKNYSRITETPVLVKFDSGSDGAVDTLVVRSIVMEAYRDSTRRLLATDSVQIIRANLSATCGFAQFFSESDSMQLRKSPIIWYERTQVAGDSINVFLHQNRLDWLDVKGNALAISQSDSIRKNRYDQIAGEEIVMKFDTAGLNHIDVNTRAISVYHLYEDSLPNGLNKTSGDRIVMSWSGKSLTAIRVFGGVEGQYVPENLVRGKEQEYALAGFHWREERPFLKETDFRFDKRPVTPSSSVKKQTSSRSSKKKK